MPNFYIIHRRRFEVEKENRMEKKTKQNKTKQNSVARSLDLLILEILIIIYTCKSGID